LGPAVHKEHVRVRVMRSEAFEQAAAASEAPTRPLGWRERKETVSKCVEAQAFGDRIFEPGQAIVGSDGRLKWV
jgi:hypothetical protein